MWHVCRCLSFVLQSLLLSDFMQIFLHNVFSIPFFFPAARVQVLIEWYWGHWNKLWRTSLPLKPCNLCSTFFPCSLNSWLNNWPSSQSNLILFFHPIYSFSITWTWWFQNFLTVSTMSHCSYVCGLGYPLLFEIFFPYLFLFRTLLSFLGPTPTYPMPHSLVI